LWRRAHAKIQTTVPGGTQHSASSRTAWSNHNVVCVPEVGRLMRRVSPMHTRNEGRLGRAVPGMPGILRLLRRRRGSLLLIYPSPACCARGRSTTRRECGRHIRRVICFRPLARHGHSSLAGFEVCASKKVVENVFPPPSSPGFVQVLFAPSSILPRHGCKTA
jgi:hypothetical protein